MHYQIEAWKCAEPKISDSSNPTAISKQCGRLCYRRELFMAHLHEAHHLGGDQDRQYVKEQCKKRRVGRNGQCGFWCGFCQTVVRLEKMGIEAWDERFNHIDDEHFKKGTKVEEWVPLEGEVPRERLDPVIAKVCVDPEKEAREAAVQEEEKGSDEEDSGPNAEGEGEDLVVLEAGGLEEKTARAKVAAVARARGLSANVAAGAEARGNLRRLWDCVSVFPSPFFHPSISPSYRCCSSGLLGYFSFFL